MPANVLGAVAPAMGPPWLHAAQWSQLNPVGGVDTENVWLMSDDAKANQDPIRPPTLQIAVSHVTKLSTTVGAAPLHVSAVEVLDEWLLVDVVEVVDVVDVVAVGEVPVDVELLVVVGLAPEPADVLEALPAAVFDELLAMPVAPPSVTDDDAALELLPVDEVAPAFTQSPERQVNPVLHVSLPKHAHRSFPAAHVSIVDFVDPLQARRPATNAGAMAAARAPLWNEPFSTTLRMSISQSGQAAP